MSFLRPVIQQIAKIYPMAKRYLHTFHGGVFPQYNKELSANQPVRAQIIPTKLILPLQQQVGLPADVLVQVGDYVKKNQLLAKSSKDPKKALIVPVHAPTSGVIKAIEPATLSHPSGLQDMAIILEPDGKNITIENALKVSKQPIETPDELKEILFNAGIIGMGGAGFPTYAKIPSRPAQIHTLLINGAECEPFITCDDLLMQTHAEEIVQGALITAKALGSSKIICGIESNKPTAIKTMTEAAKNSIVEIKVVESVYPMGGQKQLTLELTGIEMPKKTHAVDIGMLMMNVATFAAIYRAVMFGEPLTSRMVTVSGLGFNKPFNTIAMIGTPFSELAQAAQPKTELNYPLIMGGPMMGVKVKSNDVPISKTTNCVLANPPEPVDMQMPCIRCGQCMDACPVNLLPQQMYFHAQAHEYDKVEKLNVADCIECGCCSFVCPSHIPLVQYYRHSKSEIREIHAEQKAVALAKERHEFKMARIDREKAEREARLKAKKEAVKQQASAPKEATSEAKKPASGAAAAAARAAAAKRAAKANAEGSSATDKAIPSARLKAIEAAKKASQQSAKQDSEQGSEKTTDPKVAARNAAMIAAKKRAEAKKAAANTETSVTTPPSDESSEVVTEMDTTPKAKPDAKQAAKQAAMLAAKKRAQAKAAKAIEVANESEPETQTESAQPEIVDLTVNTPETDASRKEAARKAAKDAAKQAAKKRADEARLAKQQAQAETAKKMEQTGETDPITEKRNKAMQAARERAALRKAQKDQTIADD
ncbi:MAG: electron transport complex subunit RsxC [Thiotrichales bacterium]|nr:electron transport complex subunit RsxC [Thiotrichales bacterium]